MNERIKELAKQAGLEGDNDHYEYDWFDPEKFAELIIKECAGIDFRMELGLSGDQSYEISNLIEKHFGVE